MSTATQKAQSSGYTNFRWFVLITMLVATIGNGVTLIALSPNVNDVATTLGLNLGQTSMVTMVAYNLACAIVGLFCGKLLDLYGAGKVYTVCFIANIVVTLLYIPIGASFAGLLVIRIIQGALMVNIIGSSAHVAAIWFPAKERGIVTGVQAAAIAGGVAIGMVLSPRFTAMTGSWQKGAAMCAIVSVIALVLSLIVVAKGKAPEVVDEEVFEKVTVEEEARLYKAVWKQPFTYMVIIAGMAFGWGFNVFNDLIPGFAAVDAPVGAGYGSVVAGNMLSIAQVAFMVGALLAGMVFMRKLKGRVSIVMLVFFAIAAIGVFTLNIDSVTGSYGFMQVMCIVAGFGLGCINPLNLGFVTLNYHPAINGRMGALVMGLVTFGGVIGLAVSSVCLSVTGYYHLTIWLLGIICVVGAVFSLGVRNKKKNSPAAE